MALSRGNSLYDASLNILQRGFSGIGCVFDTPLTSMQLEDVIKQVNLTAGNHGLSPISSANTEMFNGTTVQTGMMGQPTNDLLTLPSDMRGKTVEEVWADLSDGSDASPGSSSMMHAVSHKQLMQSSGDLNELSIGAFLESAGVGGAKNLMAYAFPGSSSSSHGMQHTSSPYPTLQYAPMSMNGLGPSLAHSAAMSNMNQMDAATVAMLQHSAMQGMRQAGVGGVDLGPGGGKLDSEELTDDDGIDLTLPLEHQQPQRQRSVSFNIPDPDPEASAEAKAAGDRSARLARTPSATRRKQAAAKEARAARMQGRKRKQEPDEDNAEPGNRLQERKVKNRESAARSRNRRQQYTDELEHEVQKLTEDNEALQQKVKQAETLRQLPPYVTSMSRLRRARSTPS